MRGRARAAAKSPTMTTAAGVVIIKPRGRIDVVTAAGLSTQLLELVDTGHPRLVVDLCAVDLIDSSGLGALVLGLEAARGAGGDLKIMSPGEQPTLVLELTNLNRVLRCVVSADSFDEA